MRKLYITTVITCLTALLLAGLYYRYRFGTDQSETLIVGFLYESDESTPSTYNFSLAERALRETYPDSVQILTKSNVPAAEAEDPIRDLVRRGCALLFTNSHSDIVMELADEYPEVQFCQAAYLAEAPENVPDNYHTFRGNLDEGRYVGGIAAGMKLRELIDAGSISADEALAGYVAAYPGEEVTAGYTAFLLGIRSVVPEGTLRVRYTGTWSSFSLERSCTEELLAEGCVVISQSTDTIGPAVACEAAAAVRPVYLIGCNQSMLDTAPTTAITSIRINWAPYITEAAEAVLRGRAIERFVDGRVKGHEVSAGFDLGWVEVLELNSRVAAEGTEEQMQEAIEALKKGSLQIDTDAEELRDAITEEAA